MNRLKASQGDEELRIGGIFPVTGYLSWSGKYKRKAAELKVAMINEAGGINGRPVRLIAYDDRSSVDQAARIAETLVFRHHVSAIVGTGSLPISRAVASVANRYRTPALVNSGYAIDPAKDLFVFNTAHKTEFTVACSFQYFMDVGIRKLALLMPHGPLGDLGSWLARRVGNRMGMRIVGEERFDVTSPDVAAQLQRLRSLKPSAIFSFVTGQPAACVAEATARLGIDVPLLVSHGNANPRFLKLVSTMAVNLVVPSGKTMVLETMGADDPCRPVVVDFNTRHFARYGEPANYYSAELADAIDLVLEGVRRTGTTNPENLRDAVEGIRDFWGMQGVYDLSPIDHYGTRIEHIVLLTVKDGRWHFARDFSSLSLFEDFHGDRKTHLIGRLADLLSGSDPESLLVPPDVPGTAGAADPSVAHTGLNCTGLWPDPYFTAKLYCQQKLEMKRHVHERDTDKTRECLFRLLTVLLLQHFESMDNLKLGALELFLALFDAAMEEGADIEELSRARQHFTSEWEDVRDHERLCLWLVRVCEAVGRTLARKDSAGGLMDRVMTFIDAHLSEDLSVKRIAHEVCLSPSRLMHRMRSEHNASLAACITRARIDKARYLLRSTTMRVGAIAQEVGYRDQSYFTRAFKRASGQTPKQYRDRDL